MIKKNETLTRDLRSGTF